MGKNPERENDRHRINSVSWQVSISDPLQPLPPRFIISEEFLIIELGFSLLPAQNGSLWKIFEVVGSRKDIVRKYLTCIQCYKTF